MTATPTITTVNGLRAYVRAGTSVTDAALQSAAVTAENLVVPLLKTGWNTAGTPEPVLQLVNAIAAMVWRNADAAGTTGTYGDTGETLPAAPTVNSTMLKRHYVLAMPYLDVAGSWVG